MKIVACLYSLIFSTFLLLSQNKESTKPKEFENFFGSDCDSDTLENFCGHDDKCVLYKNELKISRIKKGKIKWTISIGDLKKGDCILLKTVSVKEILSKKYHIVYLLVISNSIEIDRKVIVYKSGKIIKPN